jgi:hypothetical protein
VLWKDGSPGIVLDLRQKSAPDSSIPQTGSMYGQAFSHRGNLELRDLHAVPSARSKKELLSSMDMDKKKREKVNKPPHSPIRTPNTQKKFTDIVSSLSPTITFGVLSSQRSFN